MAPQHKDTLSVLDTSFLNLESGTTHMHVGGIAIFDGPPPEGDELYEHIGSRLHLVPRYRQKLAEPGFELGRPVWIDDPCFALGYHVRHTALPRPGTEGKLRQLAAWVFSQQLDRSKPLWEMWFVEGLAGGRFAIVSKTHHALIDGMSGVDLLGLLFDPSPEQPAVAPAERRWEPRPRPGRAQLVADAGLDVAARPLRVAGRALGAVRHPRRTAGELAEGAKGIGDALLGPMLSPAPDVPLNRPIGPHRRVEWATFDLDDFKAIKNRLGGTVNDVVLAVVAGAVRDWLRLHGTRTEGLELRAMVPVSVRSEGERNAFGNRVAAMRGPLPVYAADPVERLRRVTDAMHGLKQSKQAVGAEVLTNLQEFAPPTLLALGARINFSTRLFNTVVTNVPGPQFPLYVLGREMVEIVPLGFLAADHTVFFAIMSYNGRLAVGLLGDRDAMSDLDTIAAGLRRSLDELKRAAGVDDRPAARGARARERAAGITTTNGRGH
ncbi:MAG TPA: wax ester/triacylglycerol synthase family O-acyltransferase [Solirubrobacteraceae bacterium]|jgi:WS/DGAT/MGAT family acyltransferase|nr:wax ester/triacylglycerol synthase family O-acyltransferase [Solirubrobacteraceae bacterium]